MVLSIMVTVVVVLGLRTTGCEYLLYGVKYNMCVCVCIVVCLLICVFLCFICVWLGFGARGTNVSPCMGGSEKRQPRHGGLCTREAWNVYERTFQVGVPLAW